MPLRERISWHFWIIRYRWCMVWSHLPESTLNGWMISYETISVIFPSLSCILNFRYAFLTFDTCLDCALQIPIHSRVNHVFWKFQLINDRRDLIGKKMDLIINYVLLMERGGSRLRHWWRQGAKWWYGTSYLCYTYHTRKILKEHWVTLCLVWKILRKKKM